MQYSSPKTYPGPSISFPQRNCNVTIPSSDANSDRVRGVSVKPLSRAKAAHTASSAPSLAIRSRAASLKYGKTAEFTSSNSSAHCAPLCRMMSAACGAPLHSKAFPTPLSISSRAYFTFGVHSLRHHRNIHRKIPRFSYSLA